MPPPPSPPPPSLPPHSPPPFAPGARYCADATCGAALVADGWRVLSEWGSIDRFGTGVMIGSHDGFMAAGWRLGAEYDTPPGNFD